MIQRYAGRISHNAKRDGNVGFGSKTKKAAKKASKISCKEVRIGFFRSVLDYLRG